MNKKINALFISIIGGLIVIEISNHFKSNYILYAILTTALIMFVLNIIIYWRNRIKIEITRQNLHDFPYSIFFTAINMSESRNSLDEKVILKCLIISLNKVPPCGKKHKHLFYIDDKNLSLEPHIKREFKAVVKKDTPQLFYSNFRRYRFCPNRGMYTHIYFTGPLDQNVSFPEFYFKRILYRLFNKTDSIKKITTEN